MRFDWSLQPFARKVTNVRLLYSSAPKMHKSYYVGISHSYHADGSVYNIDPTNSKVRRRIALANLSHISTSLLRDNFFLLHVPSEYDYVYVSGRKTEIISVLRLAYQDATGDELSLVMRNRCVGRWCGV